MSASDFTCKDCGHPITECACKAFSAPSAEASLKSAGPVGSLSTGDWLADLVPQGVAMDELVPPSHQVLVLRRRDGSWAISFGHCNPRQRKRTIFGEGADLADALRKLGENLSSANND